MCLQRSLSKPTWFKIWMKTLGLRTGTREQRDSLSLWSAILATFSGVCPSFVHYGAEGNCSPNFDLCRTSVQMTEHMEMLCRACLAVSGGLGVFGSSSFSNIAWSDSDKSSWRSSLKVHFNLMSEFSLVFLLHCKSQRILHFYSSKACYRSHVLATIHAAV